MANNDTPISHVTDTAFWVASYRAEESTRPDALFHDPLASRLTGELGHKIASRMVGSKYVRWTVTIRTVVIDNFIQELISQGVDTVLNLGAGLDTRPYRMNLPPQLKWIEVDFDDTIKFKEKKLAGETSKCNLERISLDLSNRVERSKLFLRIASGAKQVLVLTEGVIPYLTENDVAALAEDLLSQKNFKYWIGEYLAPELYGYFKNKKRQRMMRNAPFRFMPQDWFGFFGNCGWKALTIRYIPEESERLGRAIPMPWWATIFRVLMPKNSRFAKFSGFVLFTPK
jgi:methyltransferase (TIGR00027 family)